MARKDQNSIKKVVKSEAVRGSTISTFMQQTIVKLVLWEQGQIRPGDLAPTLEAEPSAVLRTDVVKMSIRLVSVASYFVTFIDIASGQVTSFYMKNESKATDGLRQHVSWIRQPSDSQMKKTVFESDKEYVYGGRKSWRCMELKSASRRATNSVIGDVLSKQVAPGRMRGGGQSYIRVSPGNGGKDKRTHNAMRAMKLFEQYSQRHWQNIQPEWKLILVYIQNCGCNV